MKKFIYCILVLFCIWSCTGKDGAVGPAGEKGEKGATGEKGPKGDSGQSTSEAYIYDFSIEVTGVTNSYRFDIPIEPMEFVLVFVKSDTFYSPLPYNGYAWDVNGLIRRVIFTYNYGSSLLFIDNDTDLPAGTKFNFRAVVIKGIPDSRLNLERYKNYENLKADYNLQ